MNHYSENPVQVYPILPPERASDEMLAGQYMTLNPQHQVDGPNEQLNHNYNIKEPDPQSLYDDQQYSKATHFRNYPPQALKPSEMTGPQYFNQNQHPYLAQQAAAKFSEQQNDTPIDQIKTVTLGPPPQPSPNYTATIPNDFEGLIQAIDGHIGDGCDEIILDASNSLLEAVAERYDQVLAHVHSNMNRLARQNLATSSWVTDQCLPSRLSSRASKLTDEFDRILNESAASMTIANLTQHLIKVQTFASIVQTYETWIRTRRFLGLYERLKRPEPSSLHSRSRLNPGIINPAPPVLAPRSVGRPRNLPVISIGDFVDAISESPDLSGIKYTVQEDITEYIDSFVTRNIELWAPLFRSFFSLIPKESSVSRTQLINKNLDTLIQASISSVSANHLRPASSTQPDHTCSTHGGHPFNERWDQKPQEVSSLLSDHCAELTNTELLINHPAASSLIQIMTTLLKIAAHQLTLQNKKKSIFDTVMAFMNNTYASTWGGPFSMPPRNLVYTGSMWVEAILTVIRDTTFNVDQESAIVAASLASNILASFGHHITMNLFPSVSDHISNILVHAMPERITMSVDIPAAGTAIFCIFLLLNTNKLGRQSLAITSDQRKWLYDSILYASFGLAVIMGRVKGLIGNPELTKATINYGDSNQDIVTLNNLMTHMNPELRDEISRRLTASGRSRTTTDHVHSFDLSETGVTLHTNSRTRQDLKTDDHFAIDLSSDLLFIICSIFYEFAHIDESFNEFFSPRAAIIREISYLSQVKYFIDIFSFKAIEKDDSSNDDSLWVTIDKSSLY